MVCFESSQLACSLQVRLVWAPHANFTRFWLMRRIAVTARRYDSTTKHMGLPPTHPEKHGPMSVDFDLLEQSKEEELPLRALQGPKKGSKIVPSWNLTR